MRYRTRGQKAPLPNYTYAVKSVCDQPYSGEITGSSGCDIGEVLQTWDVVVPSYHSRSRKGEVFFNPFKSVYDSTQLLASGGAEYVNYDVCSATGGNRGGRNSRGNADVWFGSQAFTGQVLRNAGDIASLVTEVSTEVLGRRGKGSLNMWENIAEIHKTLPLLRGSLNQIGRVTAALEKARGVSIGEVLSPVTRTKELADAWLAWRYAISPIVRDVDTVLKKLHSGIKKAERLSTRSSGSLFNTRLDSSSYVSSEWTWSFLTTSTQKVEVRAMCLDDVTSALEDDLKAFTPKDLITLPWELVNKSFVIDWFVNVGSVVGAFVPYIGARMLGSSVTTVNEVTTQFQILGQSGNNSNIVVSQDTSSILRVLKTTTRTIGLQPGLVVKHNFRFDEFTRMADALAILRQQFR